MKMLIICLFLFLISFAGKEMKIPASYKEVINDSIPAQLKGDFMDDYGIRYSISDRVWIQQPNIKYHIIRCNRKEKYLIARNDHQNPSEAGLYTRIDYMSFDNMAPYLWGFCLTVYNAKTDSLAATTAQADKKNPKKGCNGFPFSRMKKADQ
jgi:hypothetical protein